MTWNELIDLLQEIPESRREETAAFLDRDNSDVVEIDCKEEVSVMEYCTACNIGNDETTFVLST